MLTNTSTNTKNKINDKASELDKFKLFFEYVEPIKTNNLSNGVKNRTVTRRESR